jgi:hypothetical protein
MVNGDIPHGLYVCHTCDNPVCVRPDHLFLGTAQENVRDMIAKGRDAYRRQRKVRSKITEEQVIDMRARYNAGGVSLTELAETHGVSNKTISKIIRGQRWAHLPGASTTDHRHFTDVAREAWLKKRHRRKQSPFGL